MFTVKTFLTEIKIINELSGESDAALLNKCHFGNKDINKKICVGKIQTLVLTVHKFGPLSNCFLFSLPLLYMELHTYFQRVYNNAGDYQYTTAHICL